MQAIAIDDAGVCQFVTRPGCADTAETIDVLFAVETPHRAQEHCITQTSRSSHGEGSMRSLPNHFGYFKVLFTYSQFSRHAVHASKFLAATRVGSNVTLAGNITN